MVKRLLELHDHDRDNKDSEVDALAGADNGQVAASSAPSPPSAAEAMRFLLLGQQGLFQLASVRPHRRRTMRRAEVLAAVSDPAACPYSYVRLHGLRWRRGEHPDATREGCDHYGRNLWLDLDETTLDEFEARRLALGIPEPSLIWRTGGSKAGSAWCLWKLRTPIPVDLIESCNAGLAELLGGDDCHDATRLARIPCSFHDKTGVQGSILSFTRHQHDTDELLDALARACDVYAAEHEEEDEAAPEAVRSAPMSAAPSSSVWREEPCASALIARAEAALERNERNRDYLAAMAAEPQHEPFRGGAGGEWDRHAERQSVFCTLRLAGLDPAQIAWYVARVLREPRTVQELDAGRADCVMASISDACRFSDEELLPRRVETSDPSRLPTREAQRRFLGLFPAGRSMKTGAAIEEGAKATGRDERTLHRWLSSFKRAGVIARHGRGLNLLTAAGERALRRRIFHFRDAVEWRLERSMERVRKALARAGRTESPFSVSRKVSVASPFSGSAVLAHAPP
jgi:hypothetical protein